MVEYSGNHNCCPNYRTVRHAYQHSQNTVLISHARALHAYYEPWQSQTAENMSDTRVSLIPSLKQKILSTLSFSVSLRLGLWCWRHQRCDGMETMIRRHSAETSVSQRRATQLGPTTSNVIEPMKTKVICRFLARDSIYVYRTICYRRSSVCLTVTQVD